VTRYAAFSECKGRNRVVFRLIFVIIIGGITALRSQPGVSSIDFTGQKNILLQKLDSLDMEKQSRKRLGQSIEDLEKVSTAIKDSISGLKKQIGTISPQTQPSPPKNTPETKLSFLKDYAQYIPRNTFDWIVVAVGFTAIIAGMILCIGLIGMLFKKRPRASKTPLPPLGDIFSRTERQKPAIFAAQAREPKADQNDQAVEALRQKISEQNIDDFRVAAHQEMETGKSAQIPSSAQDLKALIIEAARHGEDLRAISKKYHVGVDQVALMLRVARQENDADP
jgi:predicted DNA binding CopG/RHH family protein